MAKRTRKSATSSTETVGETASVPAAVSSPSSAWNWIGWTLIVVFYVAVRVQLLDIPLDRDEGGYGYAGQAILRGEVPYRDFLDHKPPGLFYLFTFAVMLVPPTAVGLHIFLHVWNFLGLIAIAVLARRIAGPAAGVWAAGIYALVTVAPSVQGFTASAEPLAIVPLVASLALAVTGTARSAGRRDALLVLSGVVAAIAFLIKPPVALPLLAAILLIRAEGGGRWKRDLGWWIAGGAMIGAIVASWVTAHGLWSEFWYWNATHNRHYREQSWDGWTDRLRIAISILTPDLFLPLLLAAAGCVWAAMKRHRHAWFLIAFLILSIVSCFQAGYLYLHYFAQMLAGVTLAAGIGAAAILGGVSTNTTTRRAAAVGLAAFVVAIPVCSRPWYWLDPNPIGVSLRLLGPQAFEASPLIAEHLRQQTDPGDSIFVFANGPQFAYMAERRMTGPFLFMYPMIYRFPRQLEFQQRTWKKVQQDKPAYIVYAREEALLSRREMHPFLEQRLQRELLPAYVLEGCLALTERGLLLHTELDRAGVTCPGEHPVFELWKRR